MRTLADFHQHAAEEAKRGRLHVARVQMGALERLQPTTEEELSLVCGITAEPVWALIEWKEGNHKDAIRRLQAGLTACSELTTKHGHDYLTAKRIYLASHIARVHSSLGHTSRSRELVTALIAVKDGAADRWPFDDPDSLEVPVLGDEELVLASQLQKLMQGLRKSTPGDRLGGSTRPNPSARPEVA